MKSLDWLSHMMPGKTIAVSLLGQEGVGLLARSPRYARRSPPAPDPKGLGQNGSIWPEYALACACEGSPMLAPSFFVYCLAKAITI